MLKVDCCALACWHSCITKSIHCRAVLFSGMPQSTFGKVVGKGGEVCPLYDSVSHSISDGLDFHLPINQPRLPECKFGIAFVLKVTRNIGKISRFTVFSET